jgi:outer membrane murein-binding lipoprotein Lpp
MMIRRVVASGLMVAGLGATAAACSTSSDQGEVVNVEELGPQIANLRLEVQQLREEVRTLRDEVAALTPTSALPEESAESPTDTTSAPSG